MDDQPSVPEWVVTYGDMMSLLLTFFIMLVSLSEVVAEEKYMAILNALQQHLGYRAGPSGPPGENFPLNSMMTALESLGSFTNDENGFGGVRHESVAGDELNVFRTREGESRLAGRPVFYEPFATDLTDAAKAQLVAIAAQIAGKPNKIVVRVFAAPQALPPGSPYADKIGLTYRRGRNVFRFLIAQGIDYKRMRIDAMSDTEPLSHTGDGETAMRDRVEVVVLNAFASDFVGPRASPR